MVQNKIQLLPQASQPNVLVRADKLMSQVNHQLFRQSRMYECKIDLEIAVDNGIIIDVYALVNTWWLKKAYQMAYKKFMENSEEERAMLGKNGARWNDFRVDAGLPGGAAGFVETDAASWVDPTGALSTFTLDQEYLFTQLHDAASQQFNLVFSGNPPNTYNIIDEYDRSASTSETPSTVQGAVPYDGLTDGHDDQMMLHMSADGNRPPYNKEGLENHVWTKVATLTTNSAGQQKLSTGYFTAPAGLIAITSTTPLSISQDALTLCVKEGKYKGLHAPSMLE